MTTTSEKSEFVKSIEQLLLENNAKKPLELFRQNLKDDNVKTCSWDLMPIVSQFLTSQNEIANKKVFQCCVKLITLIADNSDADEVVLQFLEEIEECEDDRKFIVLLQPFQRALLRISHKRVNSFAWAFNAIQCYLKKRAVFNTNTALSDKEKLLLDSDENVMKFLTLYEAVINFFYKDLVIYIKKTDEINSERIKAVAKFLVQLEGQLGSLDFEVFDDIKSRARLIAENLHRIIFTLINDPYKYLEERYETDKNELLRPNNLGTAVFFYLIFPEQCEIEHIPKVYSSAYLFQNSLFLVTELLVVNLQMYVEKGIKLASFLIKSVENANLSYLLLDSEDHSQFYEALANIIIHNDVESIRINALKVYENYLKVFELRGFYALVYNLVPDVRFTPLIGFTITQFKQQLADAFKSEDMPVYFRGVKLKRMLRAFCHLQKKEASDLCDLHNQIMATLNLLRFLFLRDEKNVTGIWDFLPTLEEIYFNPLRKAVELSTAHYKLKKKNLEEGKDDKAEADKLAIVVSGKPVPELSTEDKVLVLNNSLNCFDMMDSILSRLVECIELKK